VSLLEFVFSAALVLCVVVLLVSTHVIAYHQGAMAAHLRDLNFMREQDGLPPLTLRDVINRA
jgi:hypothetical protein